MEVKGWMELFPAQVEVEVDVVEELEDEVKEVLDEEEDSVDFLVENSEPRVL